ncbi:uncharacterized protein JCM6883_006898 [Sporobolomyces salmoneus]|uniref:uncharacterized protein n=1 Tax=Sporobolomyces salmoneus TaxID=183962 RepID=UPI003177572D
MSKVTLPTEMLQEILSHRLEQNELALICRSSKDLYNLARPLLYRSIMIQCPRQLKQLVLEARREDIREVKRVEIVGKGNPWETQDIEEVASHFLGLEESEKKEKEASCVKELIEGRLINSNQIQSIFIRNVVEDPNVLWSKQFDVVPSTFANLKDLSIVSHRGGLNVLQKFFLRQYLPSLERLVVCDVTYTDPGGPVPISFGNGLFPAMFMTSDASTPRLTLFRYLRHLRQVPNLLHLAVRTSRYSLRPSDKYAIVYISTRSTATDEIAAVFNELSEIVTNFSDYSLKYLTLPPSFDNGRLPPGHSSVLDDLRNLGVDVHFDGELGREIAPATFFNYLKRKEEEEAKEPNAEESTSA